MVDLFFSNTGVFFFEVSSGKTATCSMIPSLNEINEASIVLCWQVLLPLPCDLPSSRAGSDFYI